MNRQKTLPLLIGALAAIIVGIGTWLVMADGKSPESQAGAKQEVTSREESAHETPAIPNNEPAQNRVAAEAATQSPRIAPSPQVSVRELEEEFLKAKDAESRAEAARSIASMNTGEAVDTLTRLFRNSSSYTDRTSIVGALSDANAEDILNAKLALLRSALAHGQPRSVRSAALDVASQLDAPLAVDLVRQTAKSDPDVHLREVASAALAQ